MTKSFASRTTNVCFSSLMSWTLSLKVATKYIWWQPLNGKISAHLQYCVQCLNVTQGIWWPRNRTSFWMGLNISTKSKSAKTYGGTRLGYYLGFELKNYVQMSIYKLIQYNLQHNTSFFVMFESFKCLWWSLYQKNKIKHR